MRKVPSRYSYHTKFYSPLIHEREFLTPFVKSSKLRYRQRMPSIEPLPNKLFVIVGDVLCSFLVLVSRASIPQCLRLCTVQFIDVALVPPTIIFRENILKFLKNFSIQQRLNPLLFCICCQTLFYEEPSNFGNSVMCFVCVFIYVYFAQVYFIKDRRSRKKSKK